jgi:predicted nucleic acid-binding protein
LIVVDASALVDLLLEKPPDPNLVARIASATELHAPHLIDIEFLSVLRRLVGKGLLDTRSAETARELFGQLPIERYPHTLLSDRVWALRNNITTYDATYIALSEALGIPLVTSDIKLAAAPGHKALIESFAR